jgi:hypothetical protein
VVAVASAGLAQLVGHDLDYGAGAVLAGPGRC